MKLKERVAKGNRLPGLAAPPRAKTEEDEHATRPLVAAGVLFVNEEGRLLLLQPSYKAGWEIPGGFVRAGETPYEAAVREVAKELGITPPISRLLVADWAPHPVDGDKLLFVFDGGQLDPEYLDQIRPAPDEVSGYAFHDVGLVDQLLVPRLARRVLAAISASPGAGGGTVYLEHGRTLTLDQR